LHFLTGLLFRHLDRRTGKRNVARSRRLVLSFIASIGNYDYGFYWTFQQDGTIGFEVKATGSLSTTLIADGETPAGFGTIVAPNINAQYHQHIFCVRIDPMVDGIQNSLSVLDILPEVDSDPCEQGFRVHETPLRTTLEAITDSSLATSRVWLISNPTSIHETTKAPVAWKLVSKNNARLMAKPGSFVLEKGAFAQHSIWATPWEENQLFPAGFYVFNKPGKWTEDGLGAWTKEDKNLENTDFVLWHSFGITHIPRVEVITRNINTKSNTIQFR